MQSPRHEDYDSQSSFDRRHRNADFGRDSYLRMSPRSKRSCSPRKMEGPVHSERALIGRRSISLERRPYDDGSKRIRCRSPPYIEVERRRSFFKDDWVTDRPLSTPERRSRYEFFEHMDRKHDDVDYSPTRNELGYSHGSSRTTLRDDTFEGRRFDTGVRELSNQKPAVTGLYKSIGDVGPAMKPETGSDIKSASLNIGLGQLGKERVHYPDVRDAYSFEKFTSMKHYGEEEKSTAHPRDASYSDLAVNKSKESIGASHLKDYARTSPRKSRIDHLDYRDGMPFPRDSPPLNFRHMPEPLPHSRYEQRPHLDLHRQRETDTNINDVMLPYREERFSHPRTGHVDSFRLQSRTREKDDYIYPSDEIYEKRDLHERLDYSGRDIVKPILLDRVTQRGGTSDMAYRNTRSRSLLDHIPLTATNNIRLSRSPAENIERAQYLDTSTIHSRLGRKVSREDERPCMGMARDREIGHAKVDYDYDYDYDYDHERSLSPGSHKERMRSFPGFLYEREHNIEGHDLSPYDSSRRYLKRKYTMEDAENRIPSRSMTSMLDTLTRRNNHDLRYEEWIDEDARRSSYSRRTQKVYADDEFIYDPGEFIHVHEHHMRSHKYDDKYAKGYSRSIGQVGYNSNHPNRRNVLPRWKNTPIRSKNDLVAEREIDHYEPHEDTKEFKELVNDYFLSYTKKLNENPVVRRRYMEQGWAGSLFCIVCGRSLSKEFLDTQRLAMHAFMSRKGGLRAQHLGLLKAICVMLGWNSLIPVPADTPRWFPEPLSTTEALAQKQDLIIWPPLVIVHNISILNNNTSTSKAEGPTSVEVLGQYLRGKGLSGGKVKLGKPANCSIMLVKFLGTFSGLQDAEKIHQYFLKKKHGRRHLEQITSGKGKSNREDKNKEEGEGVVFGYMGIAEDLDKVDMDTKRKCSIKSKKEIQDIADAPVKPRPAE